MAKKCYSALFYDNNVRTLSPEQLHQTIHACTDINFRKYNLLDSHEIINTLKSDLALTIEIVKEWGVPVWVFIIY